MNGVAIVILCITPAAMLLLLLALSKFEDRVLNTPPGLDTPPMSPVQPDASAVLPAGDAVEVLGPVPAEVLGPVPAVDPG